MNGLAVALESAMHEVTRDPESPRASDAVSSVIEHLDEFLHSQVFVEVERVGIARMEPELRARISGMVQLLSEGLSGMLSVGVQIDQLGGNARWRFALVEAISRFRQRFERLGFPTEAPRSLPIVIRGETDLDGPSFLVANVTRRPQLAPYIEHALQGANVQEVEPGSWYAELDAFPGVWAEGSSREECLATLADVLHEWVLLKLAHGDRDIPVIDNLDPAALVFGQSTGTVLPRQTSQRELIRKFTQLGWTGPFSGGVHRFMRRGSRTVRIPNPHRGDIGIRLLAQILKQAGISDEDWNSA